MFLLRDDLTIRGVAKGAVLKVEGQPQPLRDPTGAMRVGGLATTTINRKDVGLTWNQALETGWLLGGNEAAITIDVELVQE